MMAIICLAILASLLLIGAAIDIRSRRLPNWLTAAVAALFIPYAIIASHPVDWFGVFTVVGITFVIGFTLFAFNLMGGGDVKLISGLALWAGPDFIALFILTTGLAGGLMSLGILLFRHLVNHPLIGGSWQYLTLLMADRLGLALPAGQMGGDESKSESDPSAGSLPYGVAIAAGGLTVIHALLIL